MRRTGTDRKRMEKEQKGQVCFWLLLISAVRDIYWALGRF